MDRRQFFRRGLPAVSGYLAAPYLSTGRSRLSARESIEISTRAIDVVLASKVVDMLGLLTLDWPRLYRWQRDPSAFGVRDFWRLEPSGIDVFHPAVEPASKDPAAAARRWLEGWNHLLDGQGCFLARVDETADLFAVPRTGRLGVLVGFQNSSHFRSVADVERFYALGQRVSQLTYDTANALGSGCRVPDRGLTPFGADVVAQMNRVGMAVDVSHCGERTGLDAMSASRRPVLITHSNCRALVPGHPRCKSDVTIRRMAAGGGVMGITFVRAFVGYGRPTLDDVVDHFDHVARLVGVEHVGLGSDLAADAVDPDTGEARQAYRIRGVDLDRRVFQLAEALLARGYSPDDVELVLGGNFIRALANIWGFERPREAEPEERRDPFCPPPRRSSLRSAARGGSGGEAPKG